MKKITHNIEETKELAKSFWQDLKRSKNGATIVALSGDLGAGKTTFTQFLGKAAGIKRKMSSPTFVIMKKYPLKKGGFKYLYHLDAYRLKTDKELKVLGWKEITTNPDNLILIEWPEMIRKALPKKIKKVEISHLPAKPGEKGARRSFLIK